MHGGGRGGGLVYSYIADVDLLEGGGDVKTRGTG